MAAATSFSRLLRTSSALLHLCRITTSTSSVYHHHLPRLPLPAAPPGLPLGHLLPWNTRFQSLAFSSSSSSSSSASSDSDGDSDAAPELSATEESIPEPSAREGSPSMPPDIEMKKGDWICPKCTYMNFARNIRCLQCKGEGFREASFANVEMKKGDWTCPQCDFMNFARNVRCLRCRTDRPRGDDYDNAAVKEGDWNCARCNFLNFARNTHCLECNADRGVTFRNLIVKKGDWNCPKCNFMNFARNTACIKCEDSRPKRQRPGDWECPSCKYYNFARNSSCQKCKGDRPRDDKVQQETFAKDSNEILLGEQLSTDDLPRKPKLETVKSLRYGKDGKSGDDDIMSLIEDLSSSESSKTVHL